MLDSKIQLISENSRREIDRWLKKYSKDQKRSAVLTALKLVQEENGGWLTEELMDAVAEYLGLPKIAVYEVATFYSMFDLHPVGRHKISVCTSISCMLCGADKVIHHLEKRLGVKMGGTTTDGKYTLKEAECLAACSGAPVIQVDYKKYHENITVEKVDEILNALENEETSYGQ